MIGVLDIQATEITAPEDVQQQETDAWDLAQMWAELRAELEIVGEQAKEVYRNLRRVIGYAGCRNYEPNPDEKAWRETDAEAKRQLPRKLFPPREVNSLKLQDERWRPLEGGKARRKP